MEQNVPPLGRLGHYVTHVERPKAFDVEALKLQS
jgi:hypothetical protein